MGSQRVRAIGPRCVCLGAPKTAALGEEEAARCKAQTCFCDAVPGAPARCSGRLRQPGRVCGTIRIVDLALSNMVFAHVDEAERISNGLRTTLTSGMWRSGIAAGIYAWRFSRSAARLANSVVWMRGARAMIAEEDRTVFDPEEMLRESLRQMAHGQLELHDQVVEFLPKISSVHMGGTRPALQRALRELAKQSGALVKEAEALVKVLDSQDADCSAREPGWRATSAEEVRELFARL